MSSAVNTTSPLRWCHQTWYWATTSAQGHRRTSSRREHPTTSSTTKTIINYHGKHALDTHPLAFRSTDDSGARTNKDPASANLHADERRQSSRGAEQARKARGGGGGEPTGAGGQREGAREGASPVKEWNEENALSNPSQSKTVRKRKSSLRKTALRGGRRFAAEGRERKNSLLQRNPFKAAAQATLPDISPDQVASEVPLMSQRPADDFSRPIEPHHPESLRRQFSYESSVSGSSNWTEPTGGIASRLSTLTDTISKIGAQATAGQATLSGPLDLKSLVSHTSYASTTDDDDPLTFDRLAASSLTARLMSPPAAASYFPGSTLQASSRSASRPHRSWLHRPSPLTRIPVPSSHSPDDFEYTYAETEYWGWVLLATTWIVFTVGMGSCLDVWSWVWNVDKKPYAPPELEDDPTLPIVGYYPALIVLMGGVVSWIWITVAWVGLKYFRHAKSSR